MFSVDAGEEETPEEESTENNAANTSTNKNNASKAGKSRSQEALSSFVKAQVHNQSMLSTS
jgi:hypothetical protein